MTTNVFDGLSGVAASDSRWSIQVGKWLVFVDDSQYDKIELYKSTAFMFAGQGRGVQSWKDWIRSDPVDGSQMPPVDGISVCVIDVAQQRVKFAEKQEIVRDGGYFAGSGARHAFVCWNQNRDAKRSVETAKLLDVCTGGEVKFIECHGGAHNLSYPTVKVTIDMVNEAVSKRGMVMELTTHSTVPFPLKDSVAANDSELQALRDKVAAGEVSVQAPCDEMYNCWTDEEKGKLKTVLAGVFDWKS